MEFSEKQVKKVILTIDNTIDEIDFYDEEKIKAIALDVLQKYSDLLKVNLKLIKEINKNRRNK